MAALDERIQAIEQVAMTPEAEIHRLILGRLGGMTPEQQAFFREFLSGLARTMTQKTSASRRLGREQLQDDPDFYLDLVPRRRPQPLADQPLPHRPRWYLRRHLGSGGFGEVWLAEHESLPDREAIKFCHDPRGVASLRREVETLKRVRQHLASHPHIVRLTDLNLTDEPLWLAFEYVDGGTLLDVMQQRHLAWAESLRVFTQIVDGVAAAHRLGIVHRDLKPANVLITAAGIPKVTDFGLGRLADAAQTTSHLAMGTVGYASPEQVQGQKPDPSDDVYALAVIFSQLVTHEIRPPDYLRKRLQERRVPALAQKLLLDCLDQPRGQRPKDAGVLLKRLQTLPRTVSDDAADFETLRDEAATARDKATAQQEAQFARQLAEERARAKADAAQQAKRLDELRQTAPTQATSGTAGVDFAADWARFQKLRQQREDLPKKYVDERTKEEKRIAESLKAALAKLGRFNPAPRDEEFEHLHEYEARIAEEKTRHETQRRAIEALWAKTKTKNLAKINAAEAAAAASLKIIDDELAALSARRYAYAVKPLTDFRYELEKQALTFAGELRAVLALQKFQFRHRAQVEREVGKLYRQKPDSLSLKVVLGFDANQGSIAVKETFLNVRDIGRFAAQGDWNLTDDVDGCAVVLGLAIFFGFIGLILWASSR